LPLVPPVHRHLFQASHFIFRLCSFLFSSSKDHSEGLGTRQTTAPSLT
jgi:hypothetical protein